ncbi:hypothetical protein QRX60_29390 [Amycolatopsis mongoliensis]|uniref:Uncharacterized protein n=1 Tax=Amycolatopsis mongoliensis TaxID=715475 RepID=A0A9Y2JGG8_9PSEU|nr:hypothetical protein [Amycolatopsis sp. 4-36]WIX98180.1 hypothetical protein QRX60_29390 [Amycolatopsis sp. 4-36]
MSASESAATYPGRVEFDLDAEYPYFYISENTSLINHRVSTWSGMVTASAGKLKLQLPSCASVASVAVEMHHAEPADFLDCFEDVVEFGYPSATGCPAMLDWSRALVCELRPLPGGPGDYRIRYHVKGPAGSAGRSDFRSSEKAEALVQIWPGSPGQLKELKITGVLGSFWHPGDRLRRALEF